MRLYHQDLLGVKVSDKNQTYYGLPVNGPCIHDPPPKKKKKGEMEESPKSDSDDEVQNALYQKPDAISLSIYDEQNILKKTI